jgi:copper chaperone CopZ
MILLTIPILRNHKMKNFFIIILAIFSLMAFKNIQKPTTAKFKVFGNCPQCKERIELALDVKGVKSAEWNVDTKIIEVVFIADKISLDKIHLLIANCGHDTEKTKAPDNVYLKLPDCCMYRDNDNTHHD